VKGVITDKIKAKQPNILNFHIIFISILIFSKPIQNNYIYGLRALEIFLEKLSLVVKEMSK